MDVKGSQNFENEKVKLGVAFSQGGREYMQDVFVVDLDASKDINPERIDFMGVMDGHGPHGESVAMFVATNLCNTVLDIYNKGHTFLEAIEMACLIIDNRLQSLDMLMDHTGQITGGSTCTAIWIKEKKIFSCNVGDSRFILSYRGKAYPVTEDHKPESLRERQRIYNAGAYIQDNRVAGVLGVARAFGDFPFKSELHLSNIEQAVSAFPDVFTVDIDPNIDFMVLASDGVWDILSNQQVVDFVMKHINSVMPLNKIATLLIDSCYNLVPQWCGMGSDNLTCIIAMFKNQQKSSMHRR